jgi:hypothetical protein
MKRKKKPIKINTNWTQGDVEDLAAEIAWMQDAGGGCNFRKKDEQITIKRGTTTLNNGHRSPRWRYTDIRNIGLNRPKLDGKYA